MKTNRIYFIDAVRAFAILMMLQGHFIDTLLAVEFRDTTNIAYRIWQYFRGITAPTFFTISGLIFTYLLMKARDKGTSQERIKKGLFVGLCLLVLAMPYGFLFLDGFQVILGLILWLLMYCNALDCRY